jgi:molybdopterin converting factor small subunit
MKVMIRYMAHLKLAAGIAAEEIELNEPCSAAELVRYISSRHGESLGRLLLDESGALQPTILLFVNDAQAEERNNLMLADGDEVSFLSPIAGG